MNLADAIDALLPQTQCGKCGYAGCRPYAEALARAEADINRCPPGGDAGVRELAALLGREVKPIDPACGAPQTVPYVAVIDEATCIGCARCLPACPVDAIVGASKFMHTVIEARCTGCELCLAPCPVDCIRLEPRPPVQEPGERRRRAAEARTRFRAHQERSAREEAARAEERRRKKEALARWAAQRHGHGPV